MEQAQEAAAEAEAERARRLRLEGEARVVQPELVERLAQFGQLVAVDGVEPAEHHGLGVAIAVEGLGGGMDGVGHRLTRTGLTDVLDARDQVADLAGTELVDRCGIGRAHTDLLDLLDGAGLHVADPRPRAAGRPPSPAPS